ncbi:MAG: NAD-dependent epimerase/dehydratase family protein [Bacteroidetes bacterium]|nr:NAD-dependent epimerase/dehydratase family protein [Bacteroidota bacterium]
MKKVLITGGSGLIGTSLALQLLSKGYEVIVLDNLLEQIHGQDPTRTSPLFQKIKGKVDFFQGNVCRKTDWEKVLPGVEVVVHLAAETGTGQSMYEISRYVDVNIAGTGHLLDILANKKTNVQKVIIASSRSIYGEGKYFSKELGIVYPGHRNAEDMSRGDFEVKYPGNISPLELLATDENSKIHPSSVYGITKQNQEQMIMCVCKSLGIHGITLRFQNVYGAGQSLKNPYTGILSIFSTLIKNNKPINIYEDGTESRDFVYMADVATSIILCIEKDEANGQIMNVGTGVATSVLDVAKILCKKYNIEVPINITGNFRLGDIRHNYADISKVKSLLGFEPQIDFGTGMTLFTDWVNEQAIMASKYEYSVREMKSRGLLK